MSLTVISKYRKFTFLLCQALSTKNLDSMKFLLRGVLTTREIERISSPTDLFVLLEQRNELGSNNWHILEELLTQIGRQDLVKKLKDFQSRSALCELCVVNKENMQQDCVTLTCTDGEQTSVMPENNIEYGPRGVAEKMVSKNEKVKLGEITTAESIEPLLNEYYEASVSPLNDFPVTTTPIHTFFSMPMPQEDRDALRSCYVALLENIGDAISLCNHLYQHKILDSEDLEEIMAITKKRDRNAFVLRTIQTRGNILDFVIKIMQAKRANQVAAAILQKRRHHGTDTGKEHDFTK